jgi:hypothetical protein
LFRVTLLPCNDFQLPKSDILVVTVGSVVKLFTPEAKNRYATIGRTNKTNRTIFFFIILDVIYAKIKKGTQCVPFF